MILCAIQIATPFLAMQFVIYMLIATLIRNGNGSVIVYFEIFWNTEILK